FMRVARSVVKILSLTVGGSITFVALMATAGLVVESGWIRSIVAGLVMLAVPGVIVDRLLPENVDAKAKGLPTDVFALVWLGIALLVTLALHDLTQPALLTEGDPLSKAGYPRLAQLAYFVAGVTPTAEVSPLPPTATKKPAVKPPTKSSAPAESEAPSTTTTASASGSGSASASASASTPAPAEPAAERDAATLFAELAPAVVTVAVGDNQRVITGGTGFLVDTEGTIATNQHVISSATKVRVTFMNRAVFNAPELLTEDASIDLALLRINLSQPDEGEAVRIPPLTLGDSESVVVGERAISIGNPLGLDHTLTDGLISARRVYEGRQWIQTSVPISPGNSGGPLLNLRGEVIGVSTASLGGLFGLAQNLNLAIPVNVLKDLLKKKHP